jgi:hypothetical protein
MLLTIIGSPFHIGLPAGRSAIVVEGRLSTILDQLSLDVPHQPLAPFLVGLARLPIC